MVNIMTGAGQTEPAGDQDRSLVDLIQDGELLPIISGEALEDLIIGSHAELVNSYAEHIGYPLQDRSELHKLAKFRSLSMKYKDQQLKAEYLKVVSNHLLHVAQEAIEKLGTPRDHIDEAVAQKDRLKVSDFATLLGFPRLGAGASNPLEILANLPLPIFITTTPYTFIEQALRNADKEPKTEFCRWRPEFDNIVSIFNQGPTVPHYQPTKEKPLVYHLFGWDRYAASLVLTEDDYLDFLMAVAQGRGKDLDPIHSEVKSALQSKALLLMGFSLSSWSFRVMYRGLIKPMPGASLYQRYCCLQLVPNLDEKRYYESYLTQEANFDRVFWKDIEVFCREDLADAIGQAAGPGN